MPVRVREMVQTKCYDSTNYPSHGGTYVVEGCLSIRFRLARRCLRALPHLAFIHRRAL